ncbi:MAG: heavy metal translocating P-type ATPase [Gemmatimonadota bacterium]
MSAAIRPSPADAAVAAPGPRPATARCPHCGTAVEGAEDAYCCAGCEAAAAIIRGAGLERWYVEREDYAPRPEPVGGAWAAVPVETTPDGAACARLVVDGLRCASCVWLTEQVLERTPGVRQATVSYATGRASLTWDPAVIDLPALARRIAALGYRPRPRGAERAPDRDLMLRLGVAVFAALNIMGFAAAVYAGWWDPMDPAWAALFRWATLTLATPVALWCAWPFYAGAWTGLRHGKLHMDLPVSLGVAILYGHGFAATLAGSDGYLDSMAMLVALLLAGRLLESRGRRRAVEAAMSLAATAPRSARRVTNPDRGGPGGAAGGERVEVVEADRLVPGDLIDVGAGEDVAADGVVVSGEAHVRMALLTGEAEPVRVAAGGRVVAGAVLDDGALTVRVEAVGQETMLQRMAAQLEAAAERAAKPTAADRIAPWFTAATLVVATATFLGWLAAAGLDTALTRTVAVLVVACPCAIALSQPLASAAGLGAAARRGLLFRSSDALLELTDVDTVALDKTGTVTSGDLRVVDADDMTLRIAAGLERYSSHPVARAILAEASRRGIPLPRATAVKETPGLGIEGIVDGDRWRIGTGGPGAVVLERPEGEDRRVIRLADAARTDSRAAVRALEAEGLAVVMLTGDHADVAQRIARDAGVRHVLPALEPEAKAEWIRRRQSEGHRVLFAGDGINDGPALAAADVGVAMGTGAASSLLVADGVISEPSVAPLVAGIRAARACRRTIASNQRRSLIYNVLAVGAAIAGWINPLVAAVLMPLSSGIVIWGAARVEATVARAERGTR